MTGLATWRIVELFTIHPSHLDPLLLKIERNTNIKQTMQAIAELTGFCVVQHDRVRDRDFLRMALHRTVSQAKMYYITLQ